MDERIRKVEEGGVRAGGAHVLYWMRANRRVESNHALRFAIELANHLDKPLVCYERLGCDYPHANDRLHTFVLDGVPETAAALRKLGVRYHFDLAAKVKEKSREGRALTDQAASVVLDDWPATLSAPMPRFGVDAYAVDSSCIVPSHVIEGRCYAAYSMRPRVKRVLERFLKPVAKVALRHKFGGPEDPLPALDASACQIDHKVKPSSTFRGGRKEALRRLDDFVEHRLRLYAAKKNEPGAHATSNLSPYLHAGYISSLEIALRVREAHEQQGVVVEEFLEELIVRRELAFNFAWHAKRVDSLDELPEWVLKTLDAHRKDQRDPVYALDEFERAATHDDLWNAAQTELLLRGKIHGYYRMYWGKKIIEWSATPEDALTTMLLLNDKYALDGQDPASSTNILWCLGLHDRPWGERPIFGMVRYMARSGMDRKTDVKSYLREIEYLQRTGKELTT